MSEWSMIRWHGPPEAVATALRALGWYGPGEEPGAALHPAIGGFIPPAGTAPCELDGTAYAAVVATSALPTPPGLAATGPELSAALLGTF